MVFETYYIFPVLHQDKAQSCSSAWGAVQEGCQHPGHNSKQPFGGMSAGGGQLGQTNHKLDFPVSSVRSLSIALFTFLKREKLSVTPKLQRMLRFKRCTNGRGQSNLKIHPTKKMF